MQPDNKHTDKKLQELENQSLPDLSKMDEHWQQMKTMLQPGVISTKERKGLNKNYFRWIVAAIFIAGLFLLTYKLTIKPNPPRSTDGKLVQPSVPVLLKM